MGKRLENKIGIITGGGSGIGLASTKLFCEEGATVVFFGYSDERNRKVEKEMQDKGYQCEYVHCDVRVEDECNEAIDYVWNKYGRIDFYFANAGFSGDSDLAAMWDFENFDRCMKTNVYGVWYQMKRLLPLMEKQGYGSIISNNSASSLRPCHYPSYAASKGAIRAMMMDLAATYAPKGIRINKIHPGVIVTPMTAAITDPSLKGTDLYEAFLTNIPGGSFTPPEAIASAALFLASDESKHIMGAELSVDDGFNMGSV